MNKTWKDMCSKDVIDLLRTARTYAHNAKTVVTGNLVIATAARKALIASFDDEDTHIVLQQALKHKKHPSEPIGGFEYQFQDMMNTICTRALQLSQKARIEHLVGAIVQIFGPPPGISPEAAQRLSSHTYTWLNWGQQPVQKPISSMLNAVASDIETLQTLSYISRPEIEKEIASYWPSRTICIVGPRGCGKTSVLYYMAKTEISRSKPVFEVDPIKLQNGARVRGDMEDRLYALIVDAGRNDTVLLFDDVRFIDEPSIAPSNSVMSIPELFGQAHAHGVNIVMTMDEQRWDHFSACPIFAKTARRIQMKEMDERMCVDVVALRAQSTDVEVPRHVCVDICRMAKRYMPKLGMPMSAVSLMFDTVTICKPDDVMTLSQVAERVATSTGIPIGNINEDEFTVLTSLADTMKKRVLGQDEAVDTIVRSVKRNRAGFGEADRPAGSFLFLGPSGIGKTETAKALADALGTGKLHRIDMSEYSEQHTVSKLLGSPPGYVGYGEGGRLTSILSNEPFCFILLDEIEKAHPNVWNVFLPVFEEGCTTDSRGIKIDCSNATFIMTTNVGSEEFDKGDAIGFRKDESDEHRAEEMKRLARKAMKNVFPPEFLNRLDGTIIFNPLGKELFPSIAELMMNQFKARMEKVSLDITWTSAVIDLLAEKGYSATDGARPMRRTIRSEIEDPLVDLVLKQRPKAVHIRVKDKKFVFETE